MTDKHAPGEPKCDAKNKLRYALLHKGRCRGVFAVLECILWIAYYLYWMTYGGIIGSVMLLGAYGKAREAEEIYSFFASVVPVWHGVCVIGCLCVAYLLVRVLDALYYGTEGRAAS